MKILIWLLKKLYLNHKVYALNEYRDFTEKNTKGYESYWKIEYVIIDGISISQENIEYDVLDAITFERWGDYTNNVYPTKRSAAKAFSKMKIKNMTK